MKDKVLILYGGKSVEHDISIITAMQTIKFLPSDVTMLLVYIDRNGKWWIADNLADMKIYSNFSKLAVKKKRVSMLLGENKLIIFKKQNKVQTVDVDVVLNCCHGNIGEDGSVQGVFKTCGVAQSSPAVLSSALCMDKVFMKDILKSKEIDTPKYVYITKYDYDADKNVVQKKIVEKIGFPFIVKPANLGSSIGISVCRNIDQLQDALDLAFEFDEKVLIEKLVENLKELNCACFFYKGTYYVSEVNEVRNKGDIYSFQDKYLSVKSKSEKVDSSLAKQVETLTERVYKEFDCKGVVRVDFLYDTKEGILYVNEVNTIPGSLAFYLFKETNFKDILTCLLEQAKIDNKKEKSLVKTFESDALKIFDNVLTSFKK